MLRTEYESAGMVRPVRITIGHCLASSNLLIGSRVRLLVSACNSSLLIVPNG